MLLALLTDLCFSGEHGQQQAEEHAADGQSQHEGGEHQASGQRAVCHEQQRRNPHEYYAKENSIK